MHFVLIGNGIAGVTAARTLRKAAPEARITMVSDETEYPFARTALMYIYMGVLTREQTRLYANDFWETNRINRVTDRATGVEVEAKRVMLWDGEPVDYDRLLIATGSVSATYGWPGQDLGGVQGLYHLGDLDRMEAETEGVGRAAVVGGGLIGVELAEMLHVRGIEVTFLVREAGFYEHVLPPEEQRMVEAEIRRHGIDLRLSTELTAVQDDGTGRAGSVTTSTGDRVPCGWVGLATGVRPNIAWLAGSDVETGRGVLVDETLRTSAPGVFAAGDCSEMRRPLPGRRATEPLWYTGRIQGAVAAAGMLGKPTPYRPGVFFNSAKFFDIEWQTYGRIDPEPSPGVRDVVEAEDRRLVRLQFDAEDRLVGVSAMGVRLRESVCSAWIEAGASPEQVAREMPRADFDAEFTRPLTPKLARRLSAFSVPAS